MRTMVKLTVSCLLVLMALVSVAPAVASGDAGVAFYQFRGDYLGAPGTVHEARIEYQVEGRTVLTKWFTFSVEEGGAATFPVPDAASVASLASNPAAASSLEIHVYVGEILVDSLDASRFEEYNARLEQTDPAAVARLLRGHLREVEEVAAAGLAVAPPRAIPQETAGPQLTSKVLDPCIRGCLQDYLDCAKNGGGSGCEQQHYYCLLGCPNYDTDGDGVVNGSDNCDTVPNANQANCDGDSWGDVCDSLNANYQNITGEQTCWTDKDTHFPYAYFTFEHHVEWLERDVSSCGAPDRWTQRVRLRARCRTARTCRYCSHRIYWQNRFAQLTVL